MKSYPYFHSSELVCRCCGKGEMIDSFMGMIIKARMDAGIPFIVGSAYRCPRHDTEVGGGGNHPTGKAIDIKCTDKREIAQIAMSMIRAGIIRIGISFEGMFVHGDANLDHPYPAIWFYPTKK